MTASNVNNVLGPPGGEDPPMNNSIQQDGGDFELDYEEHSNDGDQKLGQSPQRDFAQSHARHNESTRLDNRESINP